MVSSEGIRIENKRIEAVKQWLEFQSVQDIQVFLGFVNFDCRFIQRFNWIAAPLTLMLKISRNINFLTRPEKSRVGVSDDNRARRDRNKLNRNEIDNVEVNGSKVGDDEVGKKC